MSLLQEMCVHKWIACSASQGDEEQRQMVGPARSPALVPKKTSLVLSHHLCAPGPCQVHICLLGFCGTSKTRAT